MKQYPLPPFWKNPEKLKAPAFAIADNLYYVGNQNVSSHLIKTDAGLILIDTAFRETYPLLLESIRSLGFDPHNIKVILHAHGHVDHCGATRKMKELTGATLALAEEDIETVERGTPLTCAEYIYGIKEFETFTVDRPLKHKDKVRVDNTVILCHHTPGHTPGVMTFTFDVKVDGKTFTAGLFGGPGLWTLMNEHRLAQGYPENRKDFGETLRYLKKLKVDIWLGAHPGQNDTFGKFARRESGEKPNPFIDPEGWQKFILKTESYFKKLTK